MAATAASRRIELSPGGPRAGGGPRRPDSAAPALRQPAVERGQVHPGRRPGGWSGSATLGHFARLEVRDDGPGIPVDERAAALRALLPPGHARPSQGIPGTGLGLAIAKSVVEAHDGTDRHRRHPGLVDHLPGPAPLPAGTPASAGVRRRRPRRCDAADARRRRSSRRVRRHSEPALRTAGAIVGDLAQVGPGPLRWRPGPVACAG